MRFLLLLLFSASFLSAQTNTLPIGYVYGAEYIENGQNLLDTVFGGQILCGGYEEVGTPLFKMQSIAPDGHLRWELEFRGPQDPFGWSPVDFRLIDGGSDYLYIYSNARTYFCLHAPELFPETLIRVSRLDGQHNVIRSMSGQFLGETNMNFLSTANGDSIYMVNDSKLAVLDVAANSEHPSLLSSNNTWSSAAQLFSINGLLGILDSNTIHLYDPSDQTMDALSLSINARELKVFNNQLFALGDDKLYSIDLNGNSTQLATISETARFEHSDRSLLFFDEADQSIREYFEASDILSPGREIQFPAKSFGAFFLSQDSLYYGGTTGIADGISPNQGHGFIHQAPMSINQQGAISVESPYDIAITAITLDSLSNLSSTARPDYFGWVNLSVTVENKGTSVINQLALVLDAPYQLCVESVIDPYYPFSHYDSLNLAAGESISLQMRYYTILTDAIVNNEDNDISVLAAFPNNWLDAQPEDNTGVAIISSTNDPASEQSSIHISPNPSSDSWKIQGIPAGASNWELYDQTGRKLRSGVANHSETTINGQALSPGIYVLRFLINNQQLATKLLIKQ